MYCVAYLDSFAQILFCVYLFFIGLVSKLITVLDYRKVYSMDGLQYAQIFEFLRDGQISRRIFPSAELELQEEVRHIFHFWIADTLQGKHTMCTNSY